MPDLLIRDFPDDDLELLDEQAARLGIPRDEYLRRHLHQEARRTASAVTEADLRAVGHLLSDLAGEGFNADAWS